MAFALIIVSLCSLASLSQDDTSKASSTPLKGGLSAYATEETSAPLMQGKACDSLPSQWQGTWQGTIERNDQRLSRETPGADSLGVHLSSEGAKASVKLVATTGGSNIAELEVVDNRRAREGDPNPDIIFFHTGGNGHLLILPGARMHTHTEHGDVYVGGNGTELIGDNVRIGSSVNTGPGVSSQPNINYNSGGIQINGPTEFHDRFFKADERIDVNNTTQISAGRVDLGPAKMYPGGQVINVTGNADSGFTITRQGDSTPPESSPTTKKSMPNDIIGKGNPAQTHTVMVAPGVFDQLSFSPMQNPDGTTGYREMLTRYTALSPDKMLVQIFVGSLGPHSPAEFTMSGYLRKSPP